MCWDEILMFLQSWTVNYKELVCRKACRVHFWMLRYVKVFFCAAAAPCHSFPKAQGPFSHCEEGRHFLYWFPWSQQFSLLVLASFPYCTNMPWTCKLLPQKESRKSTTISSGFEGTILLLWVLWPGIQGSGTGLLFFLIAWCNLVEYPFFSRKSALSWMYFIGK